jgi:hypothetical protein
MDRAAIEGQFASLVANAYSHYLKNTGKDAKDFLDPPITSTTALVERLRVENEKFENFRDERRNLLKVVTEIMKPIEGIGALVAGGAAEVFAPTAHIYAAVTFLIGAAHNVSELYDAVDELFGDLRVSILILPSRTLSESVIVPRVILYSCCGVG